MGVFTTKNCLLLLIFLVAGLQGYGQAPAVAPSSNAPLCTGAASLELHETGGAALSWSWSGPNGFTAAVQNPVIPNPTIANAGLYSVTITNAGGIQSSGSLSVSINPLPTVNPIVNQNICNGALSTAVVFSGSVPGTQFLWNNNNPLIGLAASGTGNIAAFQVQSAKTVPDTAVLTVTPQYTANGLTCSGLPQTYLYIIQPRPVVNAGPDMPICAGGSTVLSATGGISCSWLPVTGLSNAASCTPVASPSQNTIYTVTVTDAQGCMNTDAVAVNIHVPKALACNNQVLLSLDQTGTVVITPDMILQGGTPDDAVFSIKITLNGSPVPNPITCQQVGQNLTVKVTDICSNISCSGTIKVEDKLAPKLKCKDLNLSCAITNFIPSYLKNTLGIDSAVVVPIDNCDLSPTINYIDNWTDLGCTGTVNMIGDLSAYAIRKWTATDDYGNTATCNQTIYIHRLHLSDLTMPPANPIVPCTNPDITPATIGVPYYTQFGHDFPLYPNTSFCELNAVYNDQVTQICDGTFHIRRTWTIYEWCLPTGPKNPLIYVQLIKVADATGPQFVCPANLTVSTDPFTCCATVNLPDVILTDNCSRSKAISAQVEAFEYYTNEPIGTYAVGGQLTDFPGNNLWATDTLGAVGSTPCLPPGNHVVTYEATDHCGNTNTCSFRLKVDDQSVPSVSCDQLTKVALGGNGVAFIDAGTLDDGSFDNCSPVSFRARRMLPNACQPDSNYLTPIDTLLGPAVVDSFYNQVKFCCSDIGDTVLVVLRVYDVPLPAGNLAFSYEQAHSNSCMVQVLVEDKIKPVCIPPAKVAVTCEVFDPALTLYGFANATDNCCLDTVTHSANYTLFDTVCNRGTITRTFVAYDCAGNSSSCTQRINVDYNQNYFIKFPDDKLVFSCDGTVNYGVPTFFGQDCELLGYSFSDQIFTVVPDACYKIERSWSIINWCTYNPNTGCTNIPNPNPSTTLNSPNNLRAPIVSAPGTLGAWAPTVVNLEPNSPTMTDFSGFWSPNANCYTYKQIIKIIDTQVPVIDSCPAGPVPLCDLTANNPELWNDPSWYEAPTGLHDLCEGPANLSITAFDSCSGLNVTAHYFLFLDLDNNGSKETVINSEDLPPAGIVNFGNASNPNYQGGNPQPFDQRNVPAGDKFRFAVMTALNPAGTKNVFSLRFNTNNAPDTYAIPELPYGTHRIEWIVEDGCGNQQNCQYDFVVKDCKAPTIVCHNGLSVNIMPTQMVQLWATDFLQYASDNCTPSNQLKYGIRRVGQGTGFPLDANGQPQTSVVFTCDDLGMQAVELWAIDLAGNADYCETFVLVQDNNSNCPLSPAVVAGVLATETGAGLEEGTVHLTGSDPAAMLFNYVELTDNDGNYAFNNAVPAGSHIIVTPMKDDNPLNGVSTYDLVLISRHILGLEPIITPYRMIAADANKSNSITTFDIVELRKLILGIYQDLPNNTSWRFVAKDYVFPEPNNPFEDLFPEYESVNNFQPAASLFNFVALKVGDVNGNALANSLLETEDRSAGTLLFDVQRRSDISGVENDEQIKTGDVFAITFKAAEVVQGGQFTLQYPGLEVLSLEPGPSLRADNFAVFANRQALTAAWENSAVASFTVRFRAQQAGDWSQMLRLSSRITRAEAYALATADRLEVGLQFHKGGASSVAGVDFELYQNEPNPFINHTSIGFHLPEASTATLTISDATGRVCWTQKGDFAKGYNRIAVDAAALPATGLLYYQLETPTRHAAGKMVRE